MNANDLVTLARGVPAWMVLAALLAILVLAGQAMFFAYALLKHLGRRLGNARGVTVGVTGMSIECDNTPASQEEPDDA